MRRILVTGVNGFVGSWFAEHALAQGDEVIGSIRLRSDDSNIAHLKSHKRLKLAHAELTDPFSANALIADFNPTHIIHLAAQSFVGASWDQPQQTINNNIMAQLNLLEAIAAGAGTEVPRFLVIGSSEEYGYVAQDELPILETQELRPLSPYAVSKVAQDVMGYQYHRSFGLPIVRARAFNHEGARRGINFVTSNFAYQIAKIEKLIQEKKGQKVLAGHKYAIKVGDLTTFRDYTDVRDTVRAYHLLLDQGTPGQVYNICSGKATEIREVLSTLLALAGLAERDDIEIVEDPARLRPADVPILQGNHDKLTEATGWQPEISFLETLYSILQYWRARA